MRKETMKRLNKRMLLLLAATAMAFPAVQSPAVTTSLTATATFLAAITLTPTTMQFGKIVYSADPSAGTDFARIATDGSLTYGGVMSSGGGTTAVGNVAVTGTYGQSIDVRCAASGVLSNGAGKTINIDIVKVAKESATGNWASANGKDCTGIGNTVLTFNLTSGTDDDIKVGAEIIGTGASSPFVGGAYSTASGGGTNLSIDVIYT
jgi:hypothetical protein